MAIIVTKKESNGGYEEGWRTVIISDAKRGDFNGKHEAEKVRNLVYLIW